MDLLTQSREESLHTPGRPTRSHEDHRRILEAIARRDEVAAHRAMLDHLIAVETLVHRRPADESERAAARRGRAASTASLTLMERRARRSGRSVSCLACRSIRIVDSRMPRAPTMAD